MIKCIECGMPNTDPRFVREAFPALFKPEKTYWSEYGALCSAKCAVEHKKKLDQKKEN